MDFFITSGLGRTNDNTYHCYTVYSQLTLDIVKSMFLLGPEVKKSHAQLS